jgi:heptosyltransferase-2
MNLPNPLNPLPTHPRLLVAQTGFLGDVVLTTPLLSALRRTLAPDSMTVLTTPQAKPLLEHHPDVDRVVVDAKRQGQRSPSGLVCMAQELRRSHFQVAFAPHKSLRTALLLALAGIPYRLGFRQSPGWFLYHRTAVRDTQSHEVERILSLLRACEVDPQQHIATPQVMYDDAAQQHAQTLLDAAGIGHKEPVIIVCPGSVWFTKRWTIEGYAALVRRLEQTYGRTLICGGPDDLSVAQAVQTQAGGQSVCLAGQADLQTFMALIDRARIVISNDSAPMHLAVARNVPVVAIFCATTPSLGYGPYSSRAVIVEQKDLACRPCGRHGGPRCPRGTEDCMRLITVNDVLHGVDQLLSPVPSAATLYGDA